MNRAVKAVIPILVGLAIWALPRPVGLPPEAWEYFALFAAVVAALVLEPVPPALAGMIGVIFAVAARLVPITPGKPPTPADAIKWGLAGFSDPTVWLIFTAFMFALGYERTGLGKRISLELIRIMGKRSLGLGYAVALADLFLAPFMPSNTARSGGTIYPIIKNIPPLYGSTPENNPRGLGGYLMWTALATTCVTSSMFLTALAPNVLAQSLILKTVNISIAWRQWFMAFLPVGVILFAITPLLAYLVYPPSVKASDDAPRWAKKELDAMGRITRAELLMAGLAMSALAMWIWGGDWLNPTAVAVVALCLMVVLGVVHWEDVLGHKQAWNVLVWFATLVAMADGLAKTGFLSWFAKTMAADLAGLSPTAMTVALVAAFFVAHYMFASITAHVAALLPVLLAAAMQAKGLNMELVSMLLACSLGIMGVISPYATGPSPIYYGSGYIPGKDFWRLGLIFGAVYLAVFLAVGLPWNLSRVG